MGARLTGIQVEHYRREGYLVYNAPVFEPTKFAALKDCFEGLLQEWTEKKVSKSPEHMDVPHFWEPKLFNWLLDERVLDLVEPIIGPDIALFSSHFICKPAAVGKRVPWHEDSAYWKGRLDPMEVVTIWLAVDPSNQENGNMQVIPRSHHNGFSEYEKVDKNTNVFDTEIRQDQFDISKAVDCILKPNECSFHDGKLIHGSAANTGKLRRCGYTMRYMPTTVKYSDKQDGFQIYLARGKDRAGNAYGDPSKVNRAWIDAHPNGQPAGH